MLIDPNPTGYCRRCGEQYKLADGHSCPDGRVDSSTTIDFTVPNAVLPPDMTSVERSSLRLNGHFWRGDKLYGRMKLDTHPTNPVPSRCADVLTKALELTSGDRAKTHGDKRENHQNIADLWNAYYSGKMIKSPTQPFTAQDVAVMMCLLKIARMKSGTFNLDNFIDLAGYAGVAAECSDVDQ